MATGDVNPILPHGQLEPLCPGVWRVVGSLPMPLKRNMIVYRLPDGGLLLYSVVAMDDAGLAALERLGRPALMIVSHPMHTRDARFYARRYPELQILGSPQAHARLGDLRFDAAPEERLTALGIGLSVVPGLKVTEWVLTLPVEGGSALVFTDLVGEAEGRPSVVMRLLGPPGGSGVARIVKLRQIADKEQVRGFLRRAAATPAIRLIVGCHGGAVTGDGAGWLGRAADRL